MADNRRQEGDERIERREDSPSQRIFRGFALYTGKTMGSPLAFLIAVLVVVLWGLSGLILGFNQVWQLSINTLTTITTFLMVFILQYTTNRDNKAMHLKMDEVLHALDSARQQMRGIETRPDREIAEAEEIERQD